MNAHLKLIVAVALLAGTAGVFAQQRSAGAAQSVDALMGAALHQQEVDGDQQAAAATYKKVVADPRATAEIRARAQAQLDRIQAVANHQPAPRASTVLAPTATRLYSHKTTNIGFGGPSADGRYLPVVQFEAGGDLYIREVATGEMRRLTHKGSVGLVNRPEEYAGQAVFTADGRRLAFAWKNANGYELHLIDSDGRNERTVSQNPEHDWLGPVAWAADGTRVLATANAKGNVGQIGWMSLADGKMRVLKTLSWTALGKVALSPDGRHIAYDAAGTGPGRRMVFLLSADGASQAELTDGASLDEVIGWTPDGRTVLISTNRAGTTELWALPVADGKTNGAPRLVKRDLGRVQPLGVSASGSLFYTAVATTGAAYTATVDWESGHVGGANKISSNVIVDFGVDWSPDGKSLAYIAHRGSTLDRRFIEVYSVTTKTHREVRPPEDFDVFVNGGNLWSPDGKTFLVTGGNSTVRQGAFAVDMATGQTRLLVSRSGAAIHRPEWMSGGKALLYRVRDQFKPRSLIFIRHLEDGTDRQITHGVEEAEHVGFTASPDGRLLAFQPASPDMQPSLNIIPVQGGQSRRLFELPADQRMWLVGWTPDSKHILYWVRREGQRQNTQMWAIPVDGGMPTRLDFPAEVTEVRVHPDGRQVGYSITHMNSEVWTLDNLGAVATSPSR